MAEQFGNSAMAALTSAISTTPSAGTSETWAVTSTAVPFPQTGTFPLTVGPITDLTPEIVLVTAVPNSTHFTVQRGSESSTIKTHANGDAVTLALTAGSYDRGIQDRIAGKSNTGHAHVESDVTSLVSDLAGKAASSHAHAEADVTNLVGDLAGKAASAHTHAESDVTSLTSDLALKAPLASPSLTGTPTAPTASGGTNTTQVATTAFVAAVTIPESQVTNLTSDLALKAPLASPALTGTPTAPTASGGTNTTQLATTAFVQAVTIPESQVTSLVSDLALKAPLASPTFTGTMTVPVTGGAAPTADGVLGYDSTQDTWKGGGAGALSGVLPRVLSIQRSTTDTLTNSTTNEVNFATTFTMPANYIIAGRSLRVTAIFNTTNAGTPATQVLRFKAGSTVLYSVPAAAPAASVNRGFGTILYIQGTAAAGASVNVETGVIVPHNNTSTTNATNQPVLVATNAQIVLTWSLQFGGTGSADSTTLRQLIVEELG